jgi:hypothetical protein
MVLCAKVDGWYYEISDLVPLQNAIWVQDHALCPLHARI